MYSFGYFPGKLQSDAGEIPKRIHTIFKTRLKFVPFSLNSQYICTIGIFYSVNYNNKVIYSVKTQHTLVINTINLATCFGSLNHLQVNS